MSNYTYPVGTRVYSFTLDMVPADGNQSDPVIAVIRETNGEVRLKEFSNYRDAQTTLNQWVEDGVIVLAVVEGETDLGTGESSAWVRH